MAGSLPSLVADVARPRSPEVGDPHIGLDLDRFRGWGFCRTVELALGAAAHGHRDETVPRLIDAYR